MAILFEYKSRFGFPVGVETRQVIGEKFAILENGIDRFAEVTRLAAKSADVRAIGRTEWPDDGIGGHSVGEA